MTCISFAGADAAPQTAPSGVEKELAPEIRTLDKALADWLAEVLAGLDAAAANATGPPVNDKCADRIPIGDGVTGFSTVGAGTDGSSSCGAGGNTDIWYNYTATCSGLLTVSTCNDATFDTVLTIYDGCDCAPLSPELECNDDVFGVCGGNTSELTAQVVAGNCYKIRVAEFGTFSPESGTGNITITCVVPPPCDPAPGVPNDCCDTRIPIEDGVTFFSTVGAGTDGSSSCGAGGNTDIWYNYTATCTGDLTVSTCNDATFDTVLTVYDGCACRPGFGAADPELGCNDDVFGVCAGGTSELTVSVVAGNCYKIRVADFGSSPGSGTGNITITCVVTGACCFPDGSCSDETEADCNTAGGTYQGDGSACAPGLCPIPPLPENDKCADRIPIGDGVTPFSTLGAITDGPLHAACEFDGQTYFDIWYNYTATCTGDLTVSTCDDADFDTDLVIYDGCDCGAGLEDPPLGCDDDTFGCAGFTSEVEVPVVAGNCYKIRVGSFSAESMTGTGNLTITCVEPPENDLCEDRIPIFNGSTPFSTVAANTDGVATGVIGCGSSGGQNHNDIWYNYTSDFNGDLTVGTCNRADYDSNLTIYDGCDCDPVSPLLACDDLTPGCAGLTVEITIPVFAGNCYKIRLGGFAAGDVGTGTLNISKNASGACCLEDGTCVDVVTDIECDALGGLFFFREGCFAHVFEVADCANPFEDISGTGILAPIASTSDDNGDFDIPIGFTFGFFKRPHDTINIASNGYLTFGGDVSDLSNDPIPTTFDPNDLIAPFWDDLNPSQGGTVHYQTLGTPGQQRFITQWTDVPEFFSTGANTFQVVLFERTNCIEFRYGDFTADLSGSDVTIGVENQDGTAGTAVDTTTISPGSCVVLCPFQVERGPCIQGSLDIKPGSCPNPLNCTSNGVIPVALVGTDTLDVTQVDPLSLQLSRKDGAGGFVAPLDGLSGGPGFSIEDVATPFSGDKQDPDPKACCHEEAGDGVDDLVMKFRTSEACDVLGLDALADGTVFSLVLSGNLVDGTPFQVEDCMVTVPVGAADAPAISVGSNATDVWIDVTPMDDSVDGGGFAPFVRSYEGGALVYLTAPKIYQGRIFLHWSVDDDTGVGHGNQGPAVRDHGQTIVIPVTTSTSVEAIYSTLSPFISTRERRR